MISINSLILKHSSSVNATMKIIEHIQVELLNLPAGNWNQTMIVEVGGIGTCLSTPSQDDKSGTGFCSGSEKAYYECGKHVYGITSKIQLVGGGSKPYRILWGPVDWACKGNLSLNHNYWTHLQLQIPTMYCEYTMNL